MIKTYIHLLVPPLLGNGSQMSIKTFSSLSSAIITLIFPLFRHWLVLPCDRFHNDYIFYFLFIPFMYMCYMSAYITFSAPCVRTAHDIPILFLLPFPCAFLPFLLATSACFLNNTSML